MSSDVTYSPLPGCCICTNLGGPRRNADAQVKGFLVCFPHAVVMEQSSSLLEALRLARHDNAIRGKGNTA